MKSRTWSGYRCPSLSSNRRRWTRPFPKHARNLTDKKPKLPEPKIDPQEVADATLEAAETPTRAKTVGAMSLLNTTMAKFAPGLADRIAAQQVDRQHYDEPPRHPPGALIEPSEAKQVVGQTHGTGGLAPR